MSEVNYPPENESDLLTYEQRLAARGKEQFPLSDHRLLIHLERIKEAVEVVKVYAQFGLGQVATADMPKHQDLYNTAADFLAEQFKSK